MCLLVCVCVSVECIAYLKFSRTLAILLGIWLPVGSSEPKASRRMETAAAPSQAQLQTMRLQGLVEQEFQRVRQLRAHGYLEVLRRLMLTPFGGRDTDANDAIKAAKDDIYALHAFVSCNAKAMERVVERVEGRLMAPDSPSLVRRQPNYLLRDVETDPVLDGIRREIALAVRDMSLATPGDQAASQVGQYRVYWQRWWVLTSFSLLSLFNNVVCFTFAPISSAARQYYGTGVNLGHLVAFFFMSYILFSFPSSKFTERYGLRAAVLLGAWLQVIGNAGRCLGHKFIDDAEFPIVLVGQLVASLAQPFFVNTPPLVAAAWFGEDERTLATTIAVNANQFGIAVAYLAAPALVREPGDIPQYLNVLTTVSLCLAVCATVYFPSKPPTPASRSSEQRMAGRFAADPVEAKGSLLERCLSLFLVKGFPRAVLVFGVAEATINGYSTFLNSLLVPLGFDRAFICTMGVLFIVFCMLASGPLAYAVDRTRCHWVAVMACLVGLAASVLGLVLARSGVAVAGAILAAGAFVGPVQPVVMEMSAAITYPASEELMATVQQVVGNFISVIMFLVIDAIHNPALSMLGILASVVAALVAFASFKGNFVRDEIERAGDSAMPAWKRAFMEKHMQEQDSKEWGSVGTNCDAGVSLLRAPPKIRSPKPIRGGILGRADSYGSFD